MLDSDSFRAWLADAIADAPCSDNIPLIGYNQLELKDASAAPLISVLADIVLATCARTALSLPETRASAA